MTALEPQPKRIVEINIGDINLKQVKEITAKQGIPFNDLLQNLGIQRDQWNGMVHSPETIDKYERFFTPKVQSALHTFIEKTLSMQLSDFYNE